ncbi:MAG TPA: hypothetical protein H9717_03965 [Candidatus Eisenbergiella merdipullorum]|uniref:Tetratricopeptide repeat protein n=1 Tax=Candidatus Eisenbergiella merdipullorum TaxID=2838553 RepID=A0A9D2I4M1_9FIRM|nr:hypothetical protein [Candidatus Eisenbergiella merdipullorum]
MGKAVLCLGQYAKIPYTFEKTRTRVFCIEELCFFFRENAGLVDASFFTKALADWIGEQCALPELAARLRALIKGKEKPETIVPQILEYVGICSEKEIRDTQQLIRLSADVSLPEKQKARADYFLENRRFAMAIREYRSMLAQKENLIPSFEGKIWHNLGVAQAGLFLFRKAADSFEKAYRLAGAQESLLVFLAAKRMRLSEQEYLAFLTEHGEYYEASLKLEEQVTARKEAWTDARNSSRIASIRSAFFAGEEEQCGRLMQQETGRLMEAYQDYAAEE